MNNDTIRVLSKNLLKQLIWKTVSYHQGSLKNIFIHSHRRSGTTLLMQIIAQNPGIRYIDQPESIYTNPADVIRKIGVPCHGQFTEFSNNKVKNNFIRFISDIEKGLYVCAAPWNISQKTFNFSNNRLVLKLLDSKSLIDLYLTNFDAYHLYFTRHPIPVALSCISAGWGHDNEAYLNNPIFCEKHLSSKQLETANRINMQGSSFEQQILSWILANLIPIRMIRDNTLHFFSYEQLIYKGEEQISRLSELLKLPDTKGMLTTLKRPSLTEKISSIQRKKEIRENNVQTVISSWKKRILPKQRNEAQALLDLFEIDLYHVDRIFPEI